MKSSFVILDSWAKTLMCAPKEQAGELIQLLCRYNVSGDDTCDDPMVSAVFAGWKEQIDANNEAYEAKVEGARKAREKKNSNIKDNQELIPLDIKNNQEPIRDDIKSDTDNVYVYVSSNEDNNIYIVEQTENSVESDVDEVIDYLNTKTNSNFRKTTKAYRKAIRARLNEGYSLDDLKTVIDSRMDKWGNDAEMREYLRPQTLFAPSHFDAYLNEANKPRPSNYSKKSFNQFKQNVYSEEELERLIVN